MGYVKAKDIISFGGGLPDPQCLPSEEETRSVVEYISSLGRKAFQYSLTGGLTELRTEGSGWNIMRLNFSYPTEEQIEIGIQRLSDAINQELEKH